MTPPPATRAGQPAAVGPSPWPNLQHAFARGRHLPVFRHDDAARLSVDELTWCIQDELYYLLNHYLNDAEARLPDGRLANLALLSELVGGFPVPMAVEQFEELPELIAAMNRWLWRRLRGQARRRLTVPIPQFDPSAFNGAARARFRHLDEFCQARLRPFCRLVVLHGSYATLDYVEGFSDPDVYLIVKQQVCVQPRRLRALRGALLDGVGVLRSIDPTCHNGFLATNENNLNHYNQAFMPVVVFRHAQAFGGSARLRFYVRPSAYAHEQTFFFYAKMFADAATEGILDRRRHHGVALEAGFANAGNGLFQFKYFTSMSLLMPSLFLQAKGVFVYKKHSFELYQHPFLTQMSKARRAFPRRPRTNAIPQRVRAVVEPDYFQGLTRMLEQMAAELMALPAERPTANHPTPVPLAVYDEVRGQIVRQFSANPDVVALYEYGTVKCPGISDLDLIVVTRDRLTASTGDSWRIPLGGRQAAAVVLGTIIVMPEGLFRQIQRVDPVRLRRLCGRATPGMMSHHETPEAEKAALVDWIPERVARLLGYLHAETLNVREALRYVRSFSYSIERAARLLGDPYYRRFVTRVNRLRQGWRGQVDELWQLLSDAVEVGYEVLHDLSALAPFRTGATGAAWLSPYPHHYLVFAGGPQTMDPDLALALSGRDRMVPLDSCFLPHFMAYARQPGPLARQMRRQFTVIKAPRRARLGQRYSRVLETKMKWSTDAARFLRRHDLQSGLFRFGFYFQEGGFDWAGAGAPFTGAGGRILGFSPAAGRARGEK